MWDITVLRCGRYRIPVWHLAWVKWLYTFAKESDRCGVGCTAFWNSSKFISVFAISVNKINSRLASGMFDFNGDPMTGKSYFFRIYFYTLRFNEVERGVYWYHLVRLSVRLSVCGQNRVRSVSSTILIGSILYLHILSSNFRRCVACNARFEIKKFEILANFLNL